MEINSLVNTTSMRRSSSDITLTEDLQKSGYLGGASVSKHSVDQAQGILVPPPAPIAESTPEENALQKNKNGVEARLSIRI
tara:strand:- start:337 stop:579 length:243 start_codon:yes stop_codon:yes gene_type:complete